MLEQNKLRWKDQTLAIVYAEEKYIRSYWETYKAIVMERKYLGTLKPLPFDNMKRWVQHSIKYYRPFFFLLNPQDEVIGWCDLQPKAERIGYLGVGLLKAYRHQGIGKAFIQYVLQAGKDYGYTSYELEVRADNLVAIHVYEALGFKKSLYKKEALCLGLEKKDLIVMKLTEDNRPMIKRNLKIDTADSVD